MAPSTNKPTTAQQRSMDKDKKYVLSRGEKYMVHVMDGHRIYEGSDRDEALRLNHAHIGSVFTDLTIPEQALTTAQTLIEQHKASCRRVNSRFLVINKRSGKKLYSGNSQDEARRALANSTSHECYDLGG